VALSPYARRWTPTDIGIGCCYKRSFAKASTNALRCMVLGSRSADRFRMSLEMPVKPIGRQARFAAASSAPGSSKRCVGPGTIFGSFLHRSSANAPRATGSRSLLVFALPGLPWDDAWCPPDAATVTSLTSRHRTGSEALREEPLLRLTTALAGGFRRFCRELAGGSNTLSQ
jgi:hypothetical protein